VKVLELDSESDDTVVAIGVCGEFADLNRSLCGQKLHSVGYHSIDGCIYDFSVGLDADEIDGNQSYGKGDVVGCGIDWNTDEFFFTLNGQLERMCLCLKALKPS
jgi:Ran-binding protein 9/10